MALLHTQDYTVASMQAAQASGSLTAPRFWDYATSQYQVTPPGTVPQGRVVGVVCYGKNTGAYRQSMYFRLTLKRPDGTTKKGPIATAAVAVDPGWEIFSEIVDVGDQAGTWKVSAELHGDVIY